MIKTESARHHPEFDMDAAIDVYGSLNDAKSLGRELEGEMITSPYDLYAVEQLRDRLQLRQGRSIPTDVFVFGKGEPAKADGTKVGGMPYWIDDRKWPVDSNKRPLRFLAQFNFCDSKDLTGELPGDVLLMFASTAKDWLSKPIHFEWLLAGHKHVPTIDPKWLLYPDAVYHGVIYRTADYPDAHEAAEASDIGQSWNLPSLNGTKIGGWPHFIQSEDELDDSPEMVHDDPFRPGHAIVERARPSRRRFLLQVGSIQAAPDVPFPWANHADPLEVGFDEGSIHAKNNSIVFHDMGSIYIFQTATGELWSTMESY